MHSSILRVGMREFRSHLQQYLTVSSMPVAITRHGETIGFYIPTKHRHDKEEINALKQAALKLENLLLSNDVTEEELFTDFRSLRAKKKPISNTSKKEKK